MTYLNISGLLLLCLTIFSCTDESGERQKEIEQILLSQEWQYDIVQMRADAEKLSLIPTENAILDRTLSAMDGAAISFQQDSLLVVTLKTGQQLPGRWYVTPDAEYIMFDASYTIQQPQKIISVTENQVKIDRDTDNGVVFPKTLIPYQ